MQKYIIITASSVFGLVSWVNGDVLGEIDLREIISRLIVLRVLFTCKDNFFFGITVFCKQCHKNALNKIVCFIVWQFVLKILSEAQIYRQSLVKTLFKGLHGNKNYRP